MHRRGLLVCAIVALLASLSCAVRDEAKRAGVDARQLVPQPIDPQDDYFHAMDFNVVDGAPAPAVVARGGGRAGDVVGLDRRQRSAVGPADDRQHRDVRPAQDRLVSSKAAAGSGYGGYGRHNRWKYSRPRQRAVLQGSRPGPIRTGSGCGSTCAIRSARRIRSPTPSTYPGGQDRRARQDRSGRLVLRGAHGHRRPAAVSQSRLRRKRRASAGTPSGSTTIRVLLRPRLSCGPTASACRARSVMSDRIQSSRLPIPKTRSGRTSAPTSARNTSGGTVCSTGVALPTKAACSIRRCTCRGRAASTPRSSRPTTSTIPGR